MSGDATWSRLYTLQTCCQHQNKSGTDAIPLFFLCFRLNAFLEAAIKIKISESPAPQQHLKAMPNNECLRIADQLRRAFEGQAWHGPALRELLTNVTAEQANARPLKTAHSIWDLTLHIDVWAHAALQSLSGVPMPKLYGTEKDWPSPLHVSAAAWKSATDKLFQTETELAHAIERFGDERLHETVPGRQYNFYYLLHGIVQHSLYHGGQIAILKKAT